MVLVDAVEIPATGQAPNSVNEKRLIMEISNVDPGELHQYLGGIDWPANKETVVESARSNGAPGDMLEQMRNSLSGRSFSSPEEVAENMQR